MKTLGIDLSADDDKVGVCRIEWKEGGATATFPAFECPEKRTNSGLLKLMRELNQDENQDHRVAIDAPFGWPEGFRCALRRWAEEDKWVGTKEPKENDGESRMWLARRATDCFVDREVRQSAAALEVKPLPDPPLAVGVERLGVTAMRCAELLDGYYKGSKDEGKLNRIDGRVIETYPFAATAMWSARKKYVRPENKQGKEQWRRDWLTLVEAECEMVGFESEKGKPRDCCKGEGHDFDALICALVARAASLEDGTYSPEEGRQEQVPHDEWMRQVEREGWIHLPKSCSLSKLCKSRSTAV